MKLSPGGLTWVHDGVQPLGGEVAAVRGPHVTEHCAEADGEEEEKRCFLHPLLDLINTVIITIHKTVQNTKCYLLYTKAFFDNIYLK